MTHKQANEKKESAFELYETYRNHELTASFEGGLCVGKVFSKGTQVAYCEAEGWAQAEQHLRLIVDTDIEKKYQYRQGEPVSFEELKQALVEIKAYLDPSAINMLRCHYQAPNGAIELAQLAQRGQCSSTTEVYVIYASIARCLCDELAYMPPAQHNGRDPIMSMLVEETKYALVEQQGVEFILESEITRALKELQW
ncbi:hypothetical protein [Alkalimarinus alittae]|uniref:Uncharacterized protein n=1 Tax=Alkalimarinus alittae TaxID=2961619 RepID=A0ABY6MZW4_9ALTE|nr:hypothetical protein [Alkalimarinus alittae]UZE95390.1 hypothetical protein NKI27_15145 [Alkalimarinus alittae]